MEQNLDQTISLLARTPAALDALLRDLPEVWTSRGEDAGTWNVFDVLGHLNHCERIDWMPRVRIVLQSGESQAFPPLNRAGHAEEIKGKTLPQLLDEFAALRAQSLRELRALNLQSGDLELRGQHPVFGAVTLGALLSAWPVHDLTHLHQISRIMAYQYREAVGPWSAYLGVLQCGGHSAAG